MNGDNLALKIRDILRDTQSMVQQGSFWSNWEIYLALNAAQECFINTCLTHKLKNCLNTLITQTTPAASVNLSLLTNPNRYLHYVSANIVGEPNRLARIYLGNEGHVFRNVQHDFCYIENNIVTFFSRIAPVTGILYYYRYPSKIELTSVQGTPNTAIDFPMEYYDIIALHASMILGLKETQTQRDIKNKQQIKAKVLMTPQELIHRIADVDMMVFPSNKGK